MDFANIAYWTIVIFYSIFILVFGISFLITLFIKVPFVPSKKSSTRKLIKAAKLKHGDIIYDLGCGDARLLVEASKHKNIQATGFEISPLAYIIAKLNTFYNKAVSVKLSNFFNHSIKDANVIFLYLLPETLPKVKEKIFNECQKGTRVISNTFQIPELKPRETIVKEPGIPAIYVYEV